jgi:hypothetical protein
MFVDIILAQSDTVECRAYYSGITGVDALIIDDEIYRVMWEWMIDFVAW